MGLTDGIAKTTVQVEDVSTVINNRSIGIAAVQGFTKRGLKNVPEFTTSFNDFKRKFGGLSDEDDFPLYCKRALERGAKLWVSPAAHYTDITDKSTIDGVKAAITITVTADVVTFTAIEVGAGYNGVLIEITAPVSGSANVVDIKVIDPENKNNFELYKDFPEAPTAEDKLKINGISRFVEMGAVTNVIPIANDSMSGGIQVHASIVTADYVGDPSDSLGINSFDAVLNATKIAFPSIADPDVDTALIAYVDPTKEPAGRGDMVALLRTPVGANTDGILAYRNGTTPFTHVKFDSAYAFLFTGGLKILDENSLEQEISEIGDVIGAIAKKDTQFEPWFSFSGGIRGLISNVLGVVFDLGSPAKLAEADQVSNAGVNLTIDHPTFGPVLWGNETLQIADTLLKAANIVELIVHMNRNIKALAEVSQFDPNDPVMFREMFRRIRPFLDALIVGRAISQYRYTGDQNVDRIQDVEFNTVDDIDAGIYKVQIEFSPIRANKFIVMTLSITNSSVNLESISEQEF